MATWTFRIDGGPKRVNHAAICIHGVIYSFGGYCTGEDFSIRRDIDIHTFDTVSYKWGKLAYFGAPTDIPYQRYGHTAVAYNEAVYIYGGRNDVNGVSEDLFKFDLSTRTWHRPSVSGTIPLSRDGHSCCVIDNRMYLFAGFEEESMEFSKTVYELNLDTFEWKYCVVTGEEPQWRDFHSATRWQHYMVVFGGRSDEFGPVHTQTELYNNDVYMFDTRRYHWIKPNAIGQIPYGRRSHNAFEYRGKIYLFGGYNGKAGIHFNDLHVYDPEKQVWTLCKPNGEWPRVRRRACCCMWRDRVFIFGGTSPERINESVQLMDLSDLHVLDMAPSLRTLSMMAILRKRLSYDCLPRALSAELGAIGVDTGATRGPNG